MVQLIIFSSQKRTLVINILSTITIAKNYSALPLQALSRFFAVNNAIKIK
jgi:hypothetical protein